MLNMMDMILPDGRVVRVAIVENEQIFAELLADRLNSRTDVEVLFTAPNGRVMIERMDPGRLPDVVLLDVQMPELDGYGCVKWLHENHPTVRILVLTGHENSDMLARMQVLGARNFIYKSDGLFALLRAIQEVFLTGRYHHPRIKLASAYDPGLLNLTLTLALLHERKQEYYELICEDLSEREIAKRMGFSYSSVKRYGAIAKQQFGVSKRSALVARLLSSGQVSRQQ